MPRGLAAAYSIPPSRATALTRPSDHGARTVTRCPRAAQVLDHLLAGPALHVDLAAARDCRG